MSTSLKITLGIVGLLLALIISVAGISAMSYVNATNYGAKTEATLNGAYDESKNVLAQYQQKIGEAAQIPAMYKDDFKEIVNASMQGRYGANGSKATMQWLKEHDIKIDSAMYTKLQNLIEGGRKDFELSQKRMIDIRVGYDANLNYFWRGMWLRIAGFPKVDMAKFQPVTTDTVEQAFKDHKETGPLKLR